MGYAGISIATIRNPVNNDRVQINSIKSTNSEWSHNLVTDEETLGDAYGGDNYLWRIGARGLTDANANKLLEWAELNVPVVAYGYGPDGFIIWDQPVQMGIREVDRLGGDSGKRVHECTLSWGKKSSKILHGTNLLHITGPWGDIENDLPAGYEIENIDSTMFNGTLFSGSSQTNAQVYRDIIYPIAGAQITLNVIETNGSIQPVIEQYNSAGSLLSSSAAQVTTSVTVTTEATVYRLRIHINKQDQDGFVLRDPSVRAGTNTRYVAE